MRFLLPALPLLLSAAQAAEPVRLETVQTTAGKRPESTLGVPAAVTVIGGERLRETVPQTPMDALHGEVGTFVQQTTPGQAVVIVRGLKGSEVLHLVDGFRLNNAIFRNAPNQYIALVDGQSLDRIEVLRGPAGTLYGGDAMGGVVQMLTPELRFEGAEWQSQGRLRLLAGSADNALVGRVQLAGGRDGVGFSLGLTQQKVQDLRAGDGRERPFTGFSQRSIDAKAQLQPVPGHWLLLSLQRSEQPSTPRHDALVPGFGQTNPENAVFVFEPQERRFLQLRWRIDAPNALFDQAELQWGRQRIVDDRRLRDFGSLNEDRERNRVATFGASGQFHKQIGAHHLSYGFEFYRDEVESAKTRRQIETGAASLRDPRFPNESRMDSQALYVADEWQIDRLLLGAGARYSRYDIAVPASASLPGVQLRPDDVSGHLSLSYALRPDARLVLNLGRGFRPPNVFDLGVFGPRPGNRFSTPNPALKPERVHSVDGGLKWGGERVSGELIAFQSDYRDKISAVLTGQRIGSLLEVQNRNVAQLRLRGLEAGLRYRLPATAIELQASATWTRGEEQTGAGSMPADRIPPLFGKLGLRWQPRAGLDTEFYLLYAGAQKRLSSRDLVDPRLNPQGTAGWVTGNLRLGWRPAASWGVALRVENLADRHYREHGSGLDEPGRNAMLTLDLSL